MKQSRATSLLKSTISTAVGFIVALGANALVLPLFGFSPNLSQNLAITCIYTVISVARGYLLERAFEAMGWRTKMSAAATAILAERQSQITQEGWSESHDDDHAIGELAQAGASYALYAARQLHNSWASPAGDVYALRGLPYKDVWPWSDSWWKPADFRRNLIKAGALNLAELEKFDRLRGKRRPSPGAASEPEMEERRVHV